MSTLLVSTRSTIAAGLATIFSREIGPIEVIAPTTPIRLAADLLLVDSVGLPGTVGLIHRWVAMWPTTRILVLVSRPSDHVARRFRDAGAHAILSETDQPTDWLRVLGQMGSGHFCAGASFTDAPRLRDVLTERQAAVYEAIVLRGLSDDDIAAELGVSVATAETHRRNLMQKLGLHRHDRLLCHALRLGVLDPSEIPDLSPHRQATRRHSGCIA